MHIAPGKTYYIEFLKESISGALLFDKDLCNLFLIINQEDIANYAEGNSPNVIGKILTKLLDF